MDMFMDKLAQKLNAQEIIKANTAADAEEMNRLKNQIAEYNECLTKLQQMIEEGSARLQNSQNNSEDVNRLVKEAIGNIQAIQQNSAGLEQAGRQISEQLKRMETETSEKLGTISESVYGMNGIVSGVLDAKLDEVNRQLSTLSGEGLEEKFAAVDENTHKECVKVYRNVQAVVVEESGKQIDAVEKNAKEVNAMGGKVGAILGISVAALVFSLASVVLQILSALNIQLF